jgi:hypothetical protein
VGPTEVGGFGITSRNDLWLVEDVALVRQQCTEVTVKFDDAAVADFFDVQVDQDRKPDEFGRIWIHTHPGHSAFPSGTDEATFSRCFGRTDWAVMLIVARGGRVYARVRFAVGPGGSLVLPVEIDFGWPFPATAESAWQEEYRRCVTEEAVELILPRSLRESDRVSRLDRDERAPAFDEVWEDSMFSWPWEPFDDRFF